MPDNRAIEIYRKSCPTPIKMLVKSVEDPQKSSLPSKLIITTEDGREGTVYLNTAEIEVVVVSPAGDPER